MENPDIMKILDVVETRLQSKTQSIETLMYNLQKEFKDYQLTHHEKTLQEIKSTIKETVNGKIDRMSVDLKEHMERSKPVIETFENLNWVRKALIYLAVTVSTVAGALFAIREFINIKR